MNRYLLTFITLLGVIFWLFFSYAPASLIALPHVTLLGQWPGWLLQILILACLILFVAVQLVIVRATLRLRHTKQVDTLEDEMKLNVGMELFWTALPLVMTLGLAAISYHTWSSLAP